jgi:glycosyltransferase involved in cell wall biosynthesis
MPLKIAIICNTSLHVLRSRTNLVDALQAMGAKIILLSPHDDSVPALRKMGVAHEHVDINQYGTNPLGEVGTFLGIRKILQRHRPSICLCYTIKANTFGALAAQSLGIPVINNIAGSGRAFEGNGKLFQRLIIALYAVSLRRSARVFFQNSDDMKFFLQHGMVREDLAQRIPGSGVDLKRFAPSSRFPAKPVFLFLGRLLISKGAKMYVDAARKMVEQGTNASFLLVGERLDESGYVSAQDLEAFSSCDGCTYLGQVPPNQIAELLASCSFLVLPSYYGEGVPRTLLEAGAVGRPIITTNSVGCKDVIRHRVNGLRIPPRDEEQLLSAMQEAQGMAKKTVRTLGRQSREIVEGQFDENIVIQAYLDECGRIMTDSKAVVERVNVERNPRMADFK